MKSITTNSFRMLINTTKMENLFQKLTLKVLLTFSKNQDLTKRTSEMKFLKTWRICLEGSEEKLRKKESESLSS